MTTFAFVPVVPGTVHEVYIGDRLFDLSPDNAKLWIVAPEGTAVGYRFDGTSFSLPSPIILTSSEIAIAAAKNAIVAGLEIASTGTSSLNAVYSVTPTAQLDINAVVTYILLNSRFPGGVSTMPWADMNGNVHVFPNTATFNAFATAVADYVATVSLYGNSGGTVGSLPVALKAIS